MRASSRFPTPPFTCGCVGVWMYIATTRRHTYLYVNSQSLTTHGRSRHEKLTPILLTPDPGDDPQLGKGRGYTNFYRWVRRGDSSVVVILPLQQGRVFFWLLGGGGWGECMRWGVFGWWCVGWGGFCFFTPIAPTSTTNETTGRPTVQPYNHTNM